jgi:hypothetical protein
MECTVTDYKTAMALRKFEMCPAVLMPADLQLAGHGAA